MLTCVFFSCDLLHKEASVSIPSSSVHPVEIIDSLGETFKN